MTKKSNSVFAGSPSTSTVIFSVAPLDTTRTSADAFGKHPAAVAAADRTMSNSIRLLLVRAPAADTITTAKSTHAPSAADTAIHFLLILLITFSFCGWLSCLHREIVRGRCVSAHRGQPPDVRLTRVC